MKRFPALLIITLSAAVQAFGIYNVHALADVLLQMAGHVPGCHSEVSDVYARYGNDCPPP